MPPCPTCRRKAPLRAGLQGEPEGRMIPAGGLCRCLFQPQISAGTAGVAAQIAAMLLRTRQTDSSPLYSPLAGNKSWINAHRPQYNAARRSGCRGGEGPVRQSDGRWAVYSVSACNRGRRGCKHLIELSATSGTCQHQPRCPSGLCQTAWCCPGSRPRCKGINTPITALQKDACARPRCPGRLRVGKPGSPAGRVYAARRV